MKGEIDQGLVNFALASADGGFYGFSAIEGPNCVCDPVEEEGRYELPLQGRIIWNRKLQLKFPELNYLGSNFTAPHSSGII